MSKKLQKYARHLRTNSTDAETKLWHLLRNRQLEKHKFRRQHIIDPYIVDFVCLDKKIIIELDGSQHAEENQNRYDKKRTQFLENLGFSVLRFWNNDIMTNEEGVITSILQALDKSLTLTPALSLLKIERVRE